MGDELSMTLIYLSFICLYSKIGCLDESAVELRYGGLRVESICAKAENCRIPTCRVGREVSIQITDKQHPLQLLLSLRSMAVH